MDTFVDTFVNRLGAASLQALAFAAVVWVLCRSVRSLSASTRSWLWWLVAAQMIAVFFVPGTIRLPLLPAAAPATATVVAGLPSATAFIPADAALPADTWAWSRPAALLVAWGTLVAVQLAIGIVRWRRLSGIVARAMPHDDVRLETLCAQRARALGLARSPRLAVSAEVDSPQVVGMLRPTILLPLDDSLAEDEREMALMHELAHVRRGDLLLGGIPALARTLFFFHPVAHVAVREYAVCREAACDALAVDRGQLAAGAYGRLLLRLGVMPHPHHALPGASPTFRILKRRLDMLGQSQDARPRVITTLLVASLAIAAALPWRVVAADQQVATPMSAPTTTQADTPVIVDKASPAAKPAPAASLTPAARAAVAAAPAPSAPAVAVIVDKKGVGSAPAVAMYGVPAPPAPPTPATPAAPAAPAAPAPMIATRLPAPPPPPAPPKAPPAPPAPPIVHGTDIVAVDDHGPSRFEAISERNGYIRVTTNDGRWVLRDPAYLARIRAIYQDGFKDAAPEPRMDPKREAELDQRQAMLEAKMNKLAERQGELATRAADPSHPRDDAAYSQGQAAIGREQAEVGRQMGEVARERAMQGRTEAEWGQAQAERARKANEKVAAVLAEAMKKNALVRAD